MHLHRETTAAHTIRAYTETSLTIGEHDYHSSVLVTREQIVPDWPVHHLQEIEGSVLLSTFSSTPEIIIIGHQHADAPPPFLLMQQLAQHRIGLECMSIGAACRTFNVLLNEERAVALGIIFA